MRLGPRLKGRDEFTEREWYEENKNKMEQSSAVYVMDA